MQRPKLQSQSSADREAALFATSCRLLLRWLNIAEARKMVTNDDTRAAVERAEVEAVSATNDFLTIRFSSESGG